MAVRGITTDLGRGNNTAVNDGT